MGDILITTNGGRNWEVKTGAELEKLKTISQEGINIIWSADFSDLSVNSKWLLPNRIYEAGLFSVPQLCFSDNVAICKYIKSLKIGWILEDANIESLIKFFSKKNPPDKLEGIYFL